ncbi:hypothetical protein LCGC14_3159070, partial [marine sediment metagenome]
EDIQNDDWNKLVGLKTSGYESPIEIDGSATGVDANNWTWAKEQPWCTGNGTESEPYIIENITIDGQNLDKGIAIYNSDVHFIIRNSTFYNATTSVIGAGIKLVNVINGRIINNTFFNNYNGIYLNRSSSDNTISGNKVYNNGYSGIHLVDKSKNNIILENTIYNNYNGITISSSFFDRCEYNTISKNYISNNTQKGIFIKESDNNDITENIISNNKRKGIRIQWSSSNNIYKNYFINNAIHAEEIIETFTPFINYWNNSVIGNYWDNHSIEDADRDGIDDNDYTYIYGDANTTDYLPIYGDPFHYGEKIHIDGYADNGTKSWNWTSTRAWRSGSG